MYCRKDFLNLTPIERNRLADALNELYDSGRIDVYAQVHEDGWFNIHRGAEFLPWHRWYVLRMERELQSVDARVSMPYWNWAHPNARDLDAEPWKSFFGGRNNTGGRFDHWWYERLPAPPTTVTLPDYPDLVSELDRPNYAAFRSCESRTHVPGHTWTGETMSSPQSPGDPLFFLHHSNLDRIWALWQLNNPTLTQYSLDPASSDDPANYPNAHDPADQVMFAGALSGGATPESMLQHNDLGYYYPQDHVLAAEWLSVKSTNMISGDPVDVRLVTSEVNFNDVPENETTMRSLLFTVEGCADIYFEILSPGVNAPFSLDSSGPYAFPQTDFPTEEFRIWFIYTAGAAGTNDNGQVSVRAVDSVTGDEIDRWDNIPIRGNSIARPTAAIALVLDESGSMLYDAGNNRDTRLEVLQVAATTFINQLFDDNALMLVSFNDPAELVQPLVQAGPFNSSARNTALTEIANHGPPNNKPHTSIGAGIEKAAEGFDTSTIAGNFDVHAMVVFTDGLQDRAPWIADVASEIPGRMYAIGVASGAGVDSNVLREIAEGTQGFMLHQGAVSADDEFLLEKFFLQVLVGVLNRDMVRDPEGLIIPGEIEEVPFTINRSDTQFDAVVLTRHPTIVQVGIRSPNGTLFSSANLPTDAIREGATSKTIRVTLPLVESGQESWEGTWHLLMASDIKQRHPTHNLHTGSEYSIPYSAIVHATSSLNLRSSVSNSGNNPGSTLFIKAVLTEYGQPLPTHPSVIAILSPPNGPDIVLNLDETSLGEYEVSTAANHSGIYRFRVVATGLSRRGKEFTREQLLTAVVGQPTRNPDGEPENPRGGSDCLCHILRCLLSERALTPEFRKRLLEYGINIEYLKNCVDECCGEKNENGRTPDIDRLVDSQALRDMLARMLK